jgi:hypothetical protein
MTISIQFDLPLNVSQSIHSEAEGQAKIAYVMTLLKHGEIGSGIAGKLLGLSRLEVLEIMGQFGVPVFPDQSREELELEVTETIRALGDNPL